MFHLLTCLTTFNIVGYINEIELNNLSSCSVNMQPVAYWAPLNLYYCLLHFAMPCIIKPDMHHTWLCIMPWLCGGCLLCLCASFRCCFFGLVPVTSRLWGSVRLRPFVSFMDLSSSLRDFRQDDHTLEITSNFACLVARSFAMPILWYLPLAYLASHIVEPSL